MSNFIKKNNWSLNKEKKWFDFYKVFPTIYAFTIFFLFAIWAIIDIAVFNTPYIPAYTTYYEYYPATPATYGIFGWESWFLVLLVWWIIGIINAIISYIILKIFFAPMILQTKYLEMIAENTSPTISHTPTKKTTVSIEKKLEAYKNLFEQGIISQEKYEKEKNELLNEKAKLEELI